MSELGSRLLSGMRESAGIPNEVAFPIEKTLSETDHARMTLVLKHAPDLYTEPIGRGIHRPYKVRLRTAEHVGHVDCSRAIFKTVHCQNETKRYCASVDLRVTGPEREILAYGLDRAMGFNLIPPTVGREIDKIGFGSVQAWVKQPLFVEWIKKGYDYKQHPENPWLHRLAAFDFITGQLDRHSANCILDEKHRVYAIDNGYSFVSKDDRRFFKCNSGKSLIGKRVHPDTRELVSRVDTRRVSDIMKNRGFQCGEAEGVLKRLDEMRRLEVWGIMGGLWDPKL